MNMCTKLKKSTSRSELKKKLHEVVTYVQNLYFPQEKIQGENQSTNISHRVFFPKIQLLSITLHYGDILSEEKQIKV